MNRDDCRWRHGCCRCPWLSSITSWCLPCACVVVDASLLVVQSVTVLRVVDEDASEERTVRAAGSSHWQNVPPSATIHRSWYLKSRRIVVILLIVNSCRRRSCKDSSNVRTIEALDSRTGKRFTVRSSNSEGRLYQRHWHWCYRTIVVLGNVVCATQNMPNMLNHVQTSQHDDGQMMTLWRLPHFNQWFKMIRMHVRLTWSNEKLPLSTLMKQRRNKTNHSCSGLAWNTKQIWWSWSNNRALNEHLTGTSISFSTTPKKAPGDVDTASKKGSG